MTEIVKVQTPLSTNSALKEAMIYNKSRQRLVLQALDARTLGRMGRDVKAYFEAEWKGGGWEIGQRVETQSW